MIDNILVSDEVVEKHFVCDLNACKGGCCVHGESGAPLEQSELQILEDIYPKVKPYLTDEGIKAIEEQGLFTDDKGWKTTLIGGKGGPCAYVNYDKKGVAYCGIERANEAGVIDWKKPVSCHLYPVRIQEKEDVVFVNYDEWDICDPACKLGASLKVPLYQFLREALVRKYGQEFYDTLQATVEYMNEQKEDQ